MNYPKHLSEKIREEVAISYLKHELHKIFPSINANEVENLMNCKELSNPRDFWNGLHGISMGYKLKNILYLVTAENVEWKYKELNCEEITFGVELEQTKKINQGKILGKKFKKYYDENSEERKDQLNKVVELRGNDSLRENDPIIVLDRCENDIRVMSVHDGNGRLSRHLLEGNNKINAFVGIMSGEKLINYWIPTQILIDVLYYLYLAIKDKNDALFLSYINVLKDILSYSKVGIFEFEERALTQKAEYRDKILEAMRTI